MKSMGEHTLWYKIIHVTIMQQRRWKCAYIYIYIYIYICLYVSNIYMYIHTYIYIHIHDTHIYGNNVNISAYMYI